MRKPHKLNPSKRTQLPRRMIFYDTESDVQISVTDEEIERTIRYQANKESAEQVRKDHNLYLVQATFFVDRSHEKGRINTETDKDYSLLEGPGFEERFWNDVDNFCEAGRETYMFAHNAKYDVQVSKCIPNLIRLGYTLASFSDSNPLFLRFEKQEPGKPKKKKLTILSSTNYYTQSLKKLGEIFNLPKLDFDHDQEVRPHDPEWMKEAMEYGRRDVEILKVAMLHFMDFIRRENLGKFRTTVAGQAFSAFKQRFYTAEMFIHSKKEALDVERRAYAGGRNEAFHIGPVTSRTYYVDINSMYPHVMRGRNYPLKLESFWRFAKLDNLKRVLKKGMLVCCDALIETDKPLFHYKADRLMFPTGKFWTSLSTPEIILALERGLLLKVKNVAVYQAGPVFDEYVDYFYNARLDAKHNGDEVHSHLYKIFLNSLYGKFGQRNIKWEPVAEANPEEISVEYNWDSTQKKKVLHKTFGGTTFEKYDDPNDSEAFDSFPAVASHVTAYARMELLRFIEIAGWDNVHYCDTDSLFVNQVGYDNLDRAGTLDPDRLGALKLEHEIEHLVIHGCKDYEMTYQDKGKIKTDIKIKGISKNAIELPSKDGYKRFLITEWSGFTTRLRNQDFENYYNTLNIKTLKREYQKGVVTPSGRVTPHIFQQN